MNSITSTISLATRKLAAVSYIPLIGLIVIAGRQHRADSFIRFHAVQGAVLTVYLGLAYFVPEFGHYLALAIAALAVTGFIYAMNGKIYRIFGLGHFLELILDTKKKVDTVRQNT